MLQLALQLSLKDAAEDEAVRQALELSLAEPAASQVCLSRSLAGRGVLRWALPSCRSISGAERPRGQDIKNKRRSARAESNVVSEVQGIRQFRGPPPPAVTVTAGPWVAMPPPHHLPGPQDDEDSDLQHALQLSLPLQPTPEPESHPADLVWG